MNKYYLIKARNPETGRKKQYVMVIDEKGEKKFYEVRIKEYFWEPKYRYGRMIRKDGHDTWYDLYFRIDLDEDTVEVITEISYKRVAFMKGQNNYKKSILL